MDSLLRNKATLLTKETLKVSFWNRFNIGLQLFMQSISKAQVSTGHFCSGNGYQRPKKRMQLNAAQLLFASMDGPGWYSGTLARERCLSEYFRVHGFTDLILFGQLEYFLILRCILMENALVDQVSKAAIK